MIELCGGVCAGYFIVVGFGILFSVITMGVVWLDYVFGGAHKTSEQVMSDPSGASACLRTVRHVL